MMANVVSRSVEPVRFGVTYEPPVLAMEFTEARGDLLVLQIALPVAKRAGARVDDIMESLMVSHYRYLNVATVNLGQIKRLIGMLLAYHQQDSTNKAIMIPPPPSSYSENRKDIVGEPRQQHIVENAVIDEEDEARRKEKKAAMAKRFKIAVEALKNQMKRSSLVNHIDSSKKLHIAAPKAFAASLPCYVVRQIGAARKTGVTRFEPKAEAREAAVFFADISGFTKLTEKLNRHLDGAERLCTELDVVYAMILEEADALGGDALKFAGDAILFAFFVDPEAGISSLEAAVRRAALCSKRAHDRIKAHPPVEGVKLTLHAGLSSGLVSCLSVDAEARVHGTNALKRRAEFVIAGEPLADIGVAEPLAGPGETVCDPRTWTFLEARLSGSPPLTKVKTMPPEGRGYVKLGKISDLAGFETECSTGVSSLSAQAAESISSADVKRMAPYVPAAFERTLSNKQALQNFLDNAHSSKAEIRELTVGFLKINGIDLGDLKQVQKSRKMMQCVHENATNYGGSVNKLLVDDKGTLMVIVFGLPGEVFIDSPVRAVCAVLAIQRDLAANGMSCWAGLTTASTFAGVVGSKSRMEYTVMGDSVNLSARLMAACFLSFGAKTSDNALVVSEHTAKLTRYEIDYHEMQPIKVKGKSAKIHVFIPKGFKIKSPRPALDLRFRSRALKKKQLDDVLRRYAKDCFPSSHNTNTPSKARSSMNSPATSTYSGYHKPPARAARSCVIAGIHGADVNFVFGSVFPDLAPKHGLDVLQSLRSRSCYHDGVLTEDTNCCAWLGPVLRAIDLLTGEEPAPHGDEHFYPTNEAMVGPCWAVTTTADTYEQQQQGAAAHDWEKRFFKTHGHGNTSASRHHVLQALHEKSDLRTSFFKSVPAKMRPLLPLLDDLFLKEDRLGPEKWPEPLAEDIPAFDTENESRIREAYLIQVVVGLVALASTTIKPCVVVLDNAKHMDSASWAVVDALHGWARAHENQKLSSVSQRIDPLALIDTKKILEKPAPLVCLRLPVIANANQVVYLNARRDAEERSALIEVGALDEDEALEFVAFALGIQEEDAGVVRDCDALVDFASQADGKQRLLSDMLLEARRKRLISVRRDEHDVDALARPTVDVNGDLASLPAPARYKTLLLAQIDVDLPVHKHIIIRAAAALKSAFSPKMLLAFAPFDMDERHVFADLDQLCEPLPSSGFVIFVKIPASQAKPWFHADLPFAQDDDVYYDFHDPLARTAVADTLLENHVQHVIAKINALPSRGPGFDKWEHDLVHPYILARRRRWDRTARCLRGFLSLAHSLNSSSGFGKALKSK